jgi:hypothetical protein
MVDLSQARFQPAQLSPKTQQGGQSSQKTRKRVLNCKPPMKTTSRKMLATN